jgi:CRISPR/Cas system-associated exonuclease Cas4 (RecB family)
MVNPAVPPTIRLTLSQQHLYTFEVCRRRFYLRFLARVPWPEAPLGPEQELAYERGRRFHRWIERRFLGLPNTVEETDQDPVLRGWWATYLQSAPQLPNGRRFVETALTIPIGPAGRHLLTGRFDLLIVGEGEDGRGAIFDWKTGEPRPVERLRRAWQTRVYLVVLAEGGAALLPDQPHSFAPGRLSFTYWYVAEPELPRVIAYDDATHRRNRTEIEAIVAEIDRELVENQWPLTPDWNECRRCAYQALCGRQAAGVGQLDEADEDEPDEETRLEPEWG